jgi:exosortase/archaeosortase family protein
VASASVPVKTGAGLPAGTTWSQLKVMGPLLLLAVEVGILTPYVEFTSTVMNTVAHPLTINGVFFGTVLFLLLASDGLNAWSQPHKPLRDLSWFVVNLSSYYVLFRYTLWLQELSTRGDVGWSQAALWTPVALLVGASAWLTFYPLRQLRAWLVLCWEKAIGVTIITLTLILLTPEIRKLWHFISWPVANFTLWLLRLAGYQHLYLAQARNGNPIVGATDAVILEVTPFCAEMESLAAFILLGGALLIAGWKEIHRLRLTVILLLGLALLYTLNAVRLFLLIDVGARMQSSQVSVDLAHSRLSNVAFLATSIAVLLGTRRWWYDRAKPTAQAFQGSDG